MPATDSKTTAPQIIFGSPWLMASGAGFAAIISGWALVRAPWGDIELDGLLAGFLFFANLQIGMGVGALVFFWSISAKSIGLMNIRILNLSRPDIVGFLDLVSLTVFLVGALCTVAVSSLVFSMFSISLAVVAFSAFSFLMVIATYFVPVLPLMLKLRSVKFQELDRLEKRIDAQYGAMDSGAHGDRAELENLLLLRDTVRKIHILPPNGQISFLTALSAIAVSFLPSIVQNWTFFIE